ncbi:hypothetical protein [Methylobacterium brachythecii]|uniref:Uncharacterized protein n=1 Tax=Methylobacterium brachythecii TaxID=1176177 RepID=A0A7W6AI82_9HYPH|nr:hypothetical protein [Methylobacterium brachythecii]MBB3901664.1 hypothetical protein [Methylobacterium brachythecii]GLS43979.1 hypothetical protein GCM10007884_19650 [Methylobacterium brachythecii]
MSDAKAPKTGGEKLDEHRERDSGKKSDDKANPANAPGKQEKRLDEALEETFPSSDPVSVNITK